MLLKHVSLQAALIPVFIAAVLFTQGERLFAASKINALRLGIASSHHFVALTPTTDCRILLAALERGAVPADDAGLGHSSCLTKNTAFSDLIRLRLGELYAAQGQRMRAQQVWQNGELLGVYFLQKAAAKIKLDALSDAQVTLEYVYGWSGYPSTELHLSGVIALKRGNQIKALDLWQEALRFNAYHPLLSTRINRLTTTYELGQAAANSANWELARDTFSSAIELSPRDPYIWMRLGLTYLNGYADYENAEWALRYSLRYGDLEWAHWGLGRVFMAKREYPNALAEMLEAYAVSNSTRFLEHVPTLLYGMSESDLTDVAFDMLMSQRPGDGTLFKLAGTVFEDQGHPELAAALYARIPTANK